MKQFRKIKLQEGSVSTSDRSPIWYSIVSNWHSNFTILNNNVVIDGKKAHMCAMQQCYREENLNKISFILFLEVCHRFCLFVVFIERLMLLFITFTRGEIACCEQFTIKFCVNIIFFSFSHAALPLNIMKVSKSSLFTIGLYNSLKKVL